jgi:predicted  nucleic acid-binding Zn-ribbon protein
MSNESMLMQLEKLKKEIDQAKIDKATAEGRLDSLMKQLKTDYGLSSIAEAEKELNKLTDEINGNQKKVDGLFAELKTKFEW